MKDEESRFSYSGMLVFNRIYRTSIDYGFSIADIEENLPQFEKGTARAPGEGFEITPLQDFQVDNQVSLTEFMPEVDSEDYFSKRSQKILNLNYIYESYEPGVEAVVDGERKKVAVVETEEEDLYWGFPNFLIQRGGQTAGETAFELIRTYLDRHVRFEEVEFSPEFFLWLLYQTQRDGDLGPNLAVKHVSDITIQNSQSSAGDIKRVSGREVHQSHEVMKSILSDEIITTIGGEFLIDGRYSLSADISLGGRIHVKAGSPDLQEKSAIQRMILSLRFIQLVCRSYTEWKEIENKGSPSEFYERIYENIRNTNIEIGDDLEGLLNEKFPNE